MTLSNDLLNAAYCAELRMALDKFHEALAANDLHAINYWRYAINDLTYRLAELDKPKCEVCGSNATIYYCDTHARAA
jgi:hypothetical protein